MRDFRQKLLRYIRRIGAGSMLVSIIVHLVVLLLATLWVVSSVQPRRKVLFQGGDNAGPAVQHPVKMSNTQPHLDTLTKRLAVDTPDAVVSLPDLPSLPPSGSDNPVLDTRLDAVGGAGGAKGPAMPMFGFREAQPGGALIGRFYDFKQLSDAKPNPELARFQPGPLAEKELSTFTQGTWSDHGFDKFYRAPAPLYATQIFVPNMTADEAPRAYGVGKLVQGRAWAVHYHGRVSPPATGAYRFVGGADDFLVVRVDGKLVLDGGLFPVSRFKSDLPRPRAYPYDFPAPGNNLQKQRRQGFVVGNRMDMRAGLFYDIDILIGEGLGGHFYAFLLFEQEGVTYSQDGHGNPILPIFRVAATPPLDKQQVMPVHLDDGPVWRALPAL